MNFIRVTNSALSVIFLFLASCATEPATNSLSDLEQGPSSLDPPSPPDSPATPRAPIGRAVIAGAKQVGYYDMSAGAGQSYQVTPIVAGGGTPINIDDPSAGELANLNVLWVNNPDNGGFGFEYVFRLSEIAAAVQNGMILVIHDRAVTNAASILPVGASFDIVRDFTEGADINIRDSSTTVTAGLTNTSLDGGTFSSHGFASAATLPTQSKLILTSTTNSHITTFCYPSGKGAVIYSTIPLDFYLLGNGSNPPQDNFRNIYAPNVVKYALAGACAASRPGPTPNIKR